ncbi:carbon-nitrogen family hydrolase [Ligilactobacillus sp. WILCCON 0076]|uniref:Carbon-nitrogen family hydrolase n=1 Tax=Ligilactobacillus ubinensis TaxID=2876789 RepID=A0A9X2FMF7_9LACO|nr:carbon-nitrogen family hydrolase [Ligilactobacillus ubinensis]MCP0887875.1 carbon-nitrogen family hydrolase [Ligilactobacillus ubinensis]
MKVALIQIDIKRGDTEVNYAHALEMMRQALAIEKKPDVLVLPEMWNIGYALKQLSQKADVDGTETKRILQEFAQKNDVNIVAGSVATNKAGKFYNTNYVFSRNGQIINDYDKVHLFGLMQEDRFISSGTQRSNFNLDEIPASAVICYDIRFPEWLRTLMAQGSQILFVSAQWPVPRIKQWEILLQARAIENQAYVVAVNRVGDERRDSFNGHSMVIDPLGNIVVQAKSEAEEIVYADLDLEQVAKVRGVIPVFNDRRPELYR